MKKTYLIITTIFLVLGTLASCHKNVIDYTDNLDGENGFIEDPNSMFSYAKINTDVSNPEIMSTSTKTGETITWYGDKDEDGTALNLNTIEYSTSDGINNFIDFDDEGRMTSIVNNIGVSIEFEWLSTTKAVVKAHSQTDNIYISTIVDFAGDNMPDSIGLRQGSIRAGKPLSLDIVNKEYGYKSQAGGYDPDGLPETQEIHLWITQCGSNYDAKNYLILENASDGNMIGKLVDSYHLWEGSFIYQLPLSSYPSSATNMEICESIDNFLKNMETWVSGALVDSTPIIVAINNAAFMSGIGVVPVAITDAVILAVTAMNCGVSIFNAYGGVSGLMQAVNSEWYYKEYIISDLNIIPVAYTQSSTFAGEKYLITPEADSKFITLEIDGEPVIDSFVLNPSNPGSGVNYTATANYHCIPENSTITLSIRGTDGYYNSVTEYVSESGSAVLHVPGASTGVYDVCTVTIKTPTGEELTMQASLVFGN